MKDSLIHVIDKFGSLQAVAGSPEGEARVSQMYPYIARDLVSTAVASLTTGTETTLLAANTSKFHDMVFITGANDSDAAVTVDIRESTAKDVVFSLAIPAADRVTIPFNVPYKQNYIDSIWTADIPDITGTTVDITALFIET